MFKVMEGQKYVLCSGNLEWFGLTRAEWPWMRPGTWLGVDHEGQ